MEWIRDDYLVSTDKKMLSTDAVFEFMSRSYRSASRSYREVEKSIENSICYGMYHHGRQIGFARVVSDLSTVYFLSDVFVIEEYRGKGLGKWLLECITNTPDLKNLIGFLATRNAQGLYRKYGFKTLNNPRIMMLRLP
ncbi:MAG: GNAT family N-acetyltransferase [Syntrophales bacterium]